MPTHNDISIKVRVDGVDLPEFMVERDVAKRMVTWWIPSQTGKEFEIIASNVSQSPGAWRARVRADGGPAYGRVFGTKSSNHSGNIGFYRESTSVRRRFVFSRVELVDDDSLLHTLSASSVGEIGIKCYSVEVLSSYVKEDTRKVIPDNQRLHEKTKKGIVHHVGVGSSVSSSRTCYRTRDKDHLATFVFRYRPLDYLRAEGIAPQDQISLHDHSQSTGSPVASGLDPGPRESPLKTEQHQNITVLDEDDDEEIRALLAQVDEARARKRKQREGVGSASKKIKKENKVIYCPDEVIDLTL